MEMLGGSERSETRKTMSIRQLESAIIAEARRYFNNRTLRVKDLQEWSSAPIKAPTGEVTVKLPLNGVYVAIKVEHDKRPWVRNKPANVADKRREASA